jgi:hypothetical protein
MLGPAFIVMNGLACFAFIVIPGDSTVIPGASAVMNGRTFVVILGLDARLSGIFLLRCRTALILLGLSEPSGNRT